MSNSMNHLIPAQVYFISFRAVWHDLPGLNPCESLLNTGSDISFRIICHTSCTCLSFGPGIPKAGVYRWLLGYTPFVLAWAPTCFLSGARVYLLRAGLSIHLW